MAALGPTLPTWALQQVGSYLGYTGRDPNVVAKAAPDPLQTWAYPRLPNEPDGFYNLGSVDLKPQRFDDRRPKSDVGGKRLSEFFRIRVRRRLDPRID